MVVSHPSEGRDGVREDILESTVGFSWTELMRVRGYSDEWIAEVVARRDAKRFGDCH